MPFSLRQGDLQPAIMSTLRDQNERPIDLTEATVWLHLYNADTRRENLYAEATVVSAAEGVVRYDWRPSDTDTAGQFNALWEVVYPDGNRLTFDEPDPPTVEVMDDIAT